MKLVSRSSFFLPLFVLIVSLHTQYTSFVTALQVTVGAREAPDFTAYNFCDEVQEFACNNDICDQCAGSATGGGCRNGSNKTSCAPYDKCSKPDEGHCLENTWCTPGKHTMPTLGTLKHFRCISVRGIDPQQALMVYQNNDYSGDSCYIDGNGVWGSPNDEFSSSIDVLPRGTGNYEKCLYSGGSSDGEQQGTSPARPTQQASDQQSVAPRQSNYPTTGPGCNTVINSDLTDPGVCLNIADEFPDINNTYWYSNFDNSLGGRRLVRRGNDFRLSSAGKASFCSQTV